MDKVTIDLFQIYYGSTTFSRLDVDAIPINNTWHENKPLQKCFESNIIVKMFEENKFTADFVGVFSWAFYEKKSILFKDIKNRMYLDMYRSDVYTFYNLQENNIWTKYERMQKGVLEIIRYIFNKLGFPSNFERIKTNEIYCNYFVCNSEVMNDFVATWLKPFVNCLEDENDVYLQSLINIDTRYKSDTLNSKTLNKITGFNYYPLHPFLCERLFSTYLAYKNYKIKQLA